MTGERKTPFEKLLTIVITFNPSKRKGLAEVKLKTQNAVYPVLNKTRIWMSEILTTELTLNGLYIFLRKWDAKF